MNFFCISSQLSWTGLGKKAGLILERENTHQICIHTYVRVPENNVKRQIFAHLFISQTVLFLCIVEIEGLAGNSPSSERKESYTMYTRYVDTVFCVVLYILVLHTRIG